MWKLLGMTAATVLVGCANTGLAEDGIVAIETSSSPPMRIFYVDASRDDGKLTIKGAIEYPPWVRFGQFTGHIDIAISDPNGVIVERHNIEPVRRKIPRTLGRKANFIAVFSLPPRPRTIVSVSYTNADHGPAI